MTNAPATSPDRIDDMLRQMAMEHIEEAPHFISIYAGHRGVSSIITNLKDTAATRQMLLDALSFIDQTDA